MASYFVNLIFFFLPISRCFKIKCFLLKIVGHKIGNNVRLMRIRIQGVNLSIGDNTFIGDDSLIMGAPGSKVTIGKNCDISSRVNIITGTHHIGEFTQAAGKGYGDNVIIGDGVWIGFGALIMPGVTVGNGAIIAAGSVVRENVPEGVLVAGVPAKFKKYLYK